MKPHSLDLRADLALVASQVPQAAKVLDLGCGSGSLLEYLAKNRNCQTVGVEIDETKIWQAYRRGIDVLALDLDTGLDIFPDKSFDVTILSRTLPSLQHPAEVLKQMVRISDQLIVSVSNFGWWRHRLRLLTGRMPMSKELPYSWYNSPNIRFTTLVDLEKLFAELDLEITNKVAFTQSGAQLKIGSKLANLMAGAAVYVLRTKVR